MSSYRWSIASLIGVAAALSGATLQAADGDKVHGAGAGVSGQVPVTDAHSSQSSVLPFESAFRGYRGYADEPVASWREANDQVRQIGGWRAYAREAQAPAAPAPAPSADPGSTKPVVPAAMPAAGGGGRAKP